MKKILIIFAFPTLVFAYSPTSEKNCTSLDLRNETLGETRDQHDVSWCYAFAGADMLGHTFNTPEKMSAADIAIGYNETRVGHFVRWLDLNLLKRKDPEVRQMPHQNGFNKVSLINAMRDGWCPESVFPSEAWTKMSRTPEGWTAAQVPLAQAMIEISALHEIKSSLTTENVPFYYSFKNIEASDFVQFLQNKNMSGFYSSLRRAVCRDDRRAFDYKWKVKMVIKNPRIFSRISEQLEIGRLVGLDYDSRILNNSSNRGVKISELHTSSLVGRRWSSSNKSCEYLIRNSSGKNCNNSGYDPSYECEGGNLWLGESEIYKNMTSVVYMLSGPAR
jgi:hypothetical protein